MKIKIIKASSIGKCEGCGREGKIMMLLKTGARFRDFCKECDGWVDFIVVAQDIEYEEVTGLEEVNSRA